MRFVSVVLAVAALAIVAAALLYLRQPTETAASPALHQRIQGQGDIDRLVRHVDALEDQLQAMKAQLASAMAAREAGMTSTSELAAQSAARTQ